MQPEKKQLEELLIQNFRECFPDFPKGALSPSESPDFIVKLKSHNLLGIELTRLNPGNASKLDDDQIDEIRRNEYLIELAKNTFEVRSEIKLFVKFLFSEEKTISEERIASVAAKISHLIRDCVGDKNTNTFFRININESSLPKGFEEVLVVHHPGLEESVWERSNNLGISNDVLDDIRTAIVKKDEKLRLYQKQRLNYYWLLITTDRLRGVRHFNLPNKIMNHNFQSRFQSVFLFDLIKSKVFQLV